MKWDYPVPESWINDKGLGFLDRASDNTFHPGDDLNHPSGGNADLHKPVCACADGWVEYAGDSGCGFGKHIFIRHDYPKGHPLYSHYAHLSAIQVGKNTKVKCGDQIGLCGYSGRCRGVSWWSTAHLHFEIRRPIGKGYDFWPVGKSKQWIVEHYYDPIKFIREHKDEPIVNDFLQEDIPSEVEERFGLKEFDWYDDHWTGEELLLALLQGKTFINSDVSGEIEDLLDLKSYDWYNKKWSGKELLEFLIAAKKDAEEYASFVSEKIDKLEEELETLQERFEKLKNRKEVNNNDMSKALTEALKELGRVILFAVIPFAIAYVSGLPQTPITILGLTVLRGVDKFVHEVGKETDNETLIKGLSRF